MRADLSRQRRRHVLDLVRRQGILTDPRLDDSSRLTYVVGALVCDDTGFLKQDDLTEAINDMSIRQAALTILAKAAH